MIDSIQKFLALVGLLFLIALGWMWFYHTNIDVDPFLAHQESVAERISEESIPTPSTSQFSQRPMTEEPLSLQERQAIEQQRQEQRLLHQSRQSSIEKQTDMTKQYLENSLNQQQQIIQNQQRLAEQQMRMQQQQMLNQQQSVPYMAPVQVYNFDPDPYTDAARSNYINARTNQMNYENRLRNTMPHRYAHEQKIRSGQ